MPQDAFTLNFISAELNALLTGGKISKINQPEKDWLSFLIYTRSGTVKLDACTSAKFCRVSVGESFRAENPKNSPSFCMLLRKHLQNAEITKVEKIGAERIIRFDFDCFSEFDTRKMSLYFEIMGKYSNAVLTENGIIVGALKTSSLETSKRVTFTGAEYSLPEGQDKADPRSEKEIEEAFESYLGGGARFIADRVKGVAYVTADEIERTFGENVDARQVYEYLNDEKISPCITYENGKMQDFKARSVMPEQKPYPTVLQAQAAYYDFMLKEKTFADLARKLSSVLQGAKKKLEKRLALVEERLADGEKREDIKLKGELITANIYAVQRGMKRLEAVNYYDPEQGVITIELDERLTPAQNAQRYYKKYAKAKRTAENAEAQKRELTGKADYLDSIICALEAADRTDDLKGVESELKTIGLLNQAQDEKGKKKKVDEAPFRTYFYGGYKVLCGRNNAQNEALVKSLGEESLWLHAKTYHSAHVAIINEGREPTDEVIKFAAEVCAYYSAARQRDKVPVDYTKKKFVKKPRGASLGFVNYTDYKTILVTPCEHGGQRSDDE